MKAQTEQLSRGLMGFALGVIAIVGAPNEALLGGPLTPTAAVKSTIDEVLRIVSDEDLKRPEEEARRRELLERTVAARFDYGEMAKRTLAKHWRGLTDVQREEFVELFKALLSRTYANKIEGYSGEQIEYLQERIEGRFAEVRTRIASEKVEVPLDYRLLSQDGDWRAYDVVIDGVSLVRNYRGQFDRIIERSSYAELVEKLRRKSEDIKQP